MTKLQDCPFCGSDELTGPTAGQVEAHSWGAFIDCDNCTASVGTSYAEPTEEEAKAAVIDVWNRRP